jgi:hypothetical protein
MSRVSSLHHLTNQALLEETLRLAAHARAATAQLVAAIAEVDARRLYLGESCSSMFVYCTRILRLSEHATYRRIEAARLARRFPVILERLADGSLTLTNVSLLAPHLTPENHQAVLASAAHKSKHEVEQVVVKLRPRPPVPSTIRKLPDRKPPVTAPTITVTETAAVEVTDLRVIQAVPSRPALVQPLAPERYKVQFTVSRETHDRLRRVQDLLRHSIPNGDVAAIFDRALTLLLADIEKKKLAASGRPRGGAVDRARSRHIPADVRREVWGRDGGRCAFVGSNGRCEERGFLEFHHVTPYAAGGETIASNLELRCRPHNAHEAELFFVGRLPEVVRETPAAWDVETRSGPSHWR